MSDSTTSLAAEKYARAKDSAEITPRETLVELLRRIDAGETNPDALCVMLRDGGDYMDFWSQISLGEAYLMATLLKKIVWRDLGEGV